MQRKPASVSALWLFLLSVWRGATGSYHCASDREDSDAPLRGAQDRSNWRCDPHGNLRRVATFAFWKRRHWNSPVRRYL